jgi:DNA-binding Xre family transcriptional regulator
MNVPELKGMMAKKGVSGNMLASKTGIERSKLHRRLNGGKITVEEAQLIKEALGLTTEEAVAIFFN